MGNYRRSLGEKGEKLVAQALVTKGFRIVGMNVTTRWSEIDIVAYRDGVIHCVEVKTRISHLFGSAYESLTRQKFLRLRKAAVVVREKISPLVRGRLQIDFAAVELRHDAKPQLTMRWNIGPMDF